MIYGVLFMFVAIVLAIVLTALALLEATKARRELSLEIEEKNDIQIRLQEAEQQLEEATKTLSAWMKENVRLGKELDGKSAEEQAEIVSLRERVADLERRLRCIHAYSAFGFKDDPATDCEDDTVSSNT